MKNKSLLRIAGVILVIAAMVSLAIFGVSIGSFKIKPVKEIMKYGLDIEGGVVVVYEAKTDLVGADLKKALDQTKDVIGKRINALGLTEPIVTTSGNNRIRVELPGVQDAESAIKLIGKTAKLEFVLVDASSVASEGMKKNDFKSTLILGGSEVADAGLSQDKNGQAAVSLKFNAEGKKLFAEGTKKASEMVTAYGKGGQIAIILDGIVISAPRASQEILDGNAVISGSFTVDEALGLSKLIRGGSLPLELTEVQSSVIGPTLGLNALNKSIDAAKIGILMVIVFMIFYYRMPGVVSAVALMLYSVLMLYLLVLLQATITLPGIAGILLSAGIAVDANVIIFEKIKEELRNAKTIRASIDAGFKRAFVTIAEANSTTIVAALVLYAFGEGPIRGFAITLMVGIFCSMFTSIVVSKFIMKNINSAGLFENPKFYGVRG